MKMTDADRNLLRAFVEALVDAWESNKRLGDVLRGLRPCYGKEEETPVEFAERLAVVARIKFIDFKCPARVFIYKNFPKANEALYDRRPRETCVERGLSQYNGYKEKKRLFIAARQLDKKHDWAVCK